MEVGLHLYLLSVIEAEGCREGVVIPRLIWVYLHCVQFALNQCPKGYSDLVIVTFGRPKGVVLKVL
jgi:hypothetical protein